MLGANWMQIITVQKIRRTPLRKKLFAVVFQTKAYLNLFWGEIKNVSKTSGHRYSDTAACLFAVVARVTSYESVN